MAMIDTGIKIEMATASGTTAPVVAWTTLKSCTNLPALIQPSSKISTDFVGEEYISEILGKKTVSALDFTFAFDGSATGTQFRFLSNIDDNNEQHFLRITFPDGTKFEMLVECEVTLGAVTPSAEIDYTLSVTPVKNSVLSDIIQVVYVGETDPLATSSD